MASRGDEPTDSGHTPHPRSGRASGLGGQLIYVDPVRRVVIVRSTLYSVNDADTLPALRAVARAVADQRAR
ncbi:hypothetical protein AB0J52_22985 [Spirillospora sp. NPDC049652]